MQQDELISKTESMELLKLRSGLRSSKDKEEQEILDKKDDRFKEFQGGDLPPVEIVWRNIGIFIYLHGAAALGLLCIFTGDVQWKTAVWTYMVLFCGGIGITAGAHRLFAHKSYKANLPLRMILIIFQTVAMQNSVHEWCRDHRVHHKYSETNADPHNATRGFFFAHMGWLICRKHTLVKEKGKSIDMSDLEADPIVMFQKKYYVPLALITSVIIPCFVPWYFWGESFRTSWCFVFALRYCANLHTTWLVNSAAHLYGAHPYDKTINPAQNKLVAVLALGEGWHNYHHTFPWDYKTAELGPYRYNLTAAIIDFFAKIGWAFDLKTVSQKVIADRIKRTGDGSLSLPHNHHSEHHININSSSKGTNISNGPWGWGDIDISKEDRNVTDVLYPLVN